MVILKAIPLQNISFKDWKVYHNFLSLQEWCLKQHLVKELAVVDYCVHVLVVVVLEAVEQLQWQ